MEQLSFLGIPLIVQSLTSWLLELLQQGANSECICSGNSCAGPCVHTFSLLWGGSQQWDGLLRNCTALDCVSATVLSHSSRPTSLALTKRISSLFRPFRWTCIVCPRGLICSSLITSTLLVSQVYLRVSSSKSTAVGREVLRKGLAVFFILPMSLVGPYTQTMLSRSLGV